MAYTISGSLNDQTTRPGASAVLFINWIDGAGEVLSVGSQFASIGKSVWNQGTFPATAPPNAARMEINLNAYGDASSTGFALFDDVVVTIDPPTATFTATPASIAPGQPSTLTWTTTNATAVSIDNGVGAKPLNGSGSVSPTTTTIYTLTATGAGGTVTKQVTVTVNPVPSISFSASPPVIGGGESSTLSWATMNATAVSIDNGIGARSLNGSLQVSPAASTTYTLTATGAGGTKTATATVTVAPPPTILFTVTPSVVSPGGTAKLEWQVFDAATIVLDPGLGVQPFSGSMTVMPAGSTTYILTATGVGGTRTAQVLVTVAGRRRAVRH
jgi:PKD repeat protein